MMFIIRRLEKNISTTLLLPLVFILSFCNAPKTNTIESLDSPVILVIKNDSIVMIEDIKGKKHIVNTTDRVNYRISFLKVGDTLKLNEMK